MYISSGVYPIHFSPPMVIKLFKTLDFDYEQMMNVYNVLYK